MHTHREQIVDGIARIQQEKGNEAIHQEEMHVNVDVRTLSITRETIEISQDGVLQVEQLCS